jgi:thioredoxin 1
MTVMELTDTTFDEVIGAADVPVLVEFGAEWCGPCKVLEPILHELAAEEHERMVVATIDIDDNLATARRFEIMSAPTMILFVDGNAERRLVGARGKRQLKEELAGLR